MKWAVEIQNTALDRRNLIDLLDGLGFAVIDGAQFPAFTSPTIDTCDTAAEVFEQAKQLRAAFTGPAHIDPAFRLGSVIDFSFDPPRQHGFLEAELAGMGISAVSATLTIAPPKGLSPSEMARWEADQAELEYQVKLERQRSKLEPAFLNSRASKVLELQSAAKLSGETLYKVYELAEGHPTNRDAFHAQFGVRSDQFRRFQDAVHNPKVSGDWARHAYEDKPRTTNPMSKTEAEEFVRQLIDEWLKQIRASKTP